MQVTRFSSPSGGDQFISVNEYLGLSRSGQFSSPSGGDQFISETKMNTREIIESFRLLLAEISSYHVAEILGYANTRDVFVSFWRRSVHIRSC